ncbi:MAG: hypothetical protein ACRD02_06400 [Acidimicrobiia bacterium]
MVALMMLEAVVIGLLAVLVVGLLRSHAEILRKLHDLGLGEEEPARWREGRSVAHSRTGSTAA